MERLNKTKAIRAKCLDCCCYQANEVKLCPCKDCPLWCYRLGYEVDEEGNRVKHREMTEEQKEANAERMRKMHEQHKL